MAFKENSSRNEELVKFSELFKILLEQCIKQICASNELVLARSDLNLMIAAAADFREIMDAKDYSLSQQQEAIAVLQDLYEKIFQPLLEADEKKILLEGLEESGMGAGSVDLVEDLRRGYPELNDLPLMESLKQLKNSLRYECEVNRLTKAPVLSGSPTSVVEMTSFDNRDHLTMANLFPSAVAVLRPAETKWALAIDGGASPRKMICEWKDSPTSGH